MARLKVMIVPVTPFEQNCSIVWDTDTMKGAVVDPGGDVPRIQGALAELKVVPEKILITHGHIDHVGGAAELAELLGVPIEGPHEADVPLLANLPSQGARFGLAGVRAMTPDRWLVEGDTVTVGGLTFDVLHVPGHAPGHVVFVHHPSEFALVGDTVFQGSVGRTDLPGGDHDLLIKGIKEKILPLGDAFTVLPGHGPATTIERERLSNPFLR
ncbi:MBL fold metallo-hydrolase [Phreatobacter sp.]|uniref:MBL fold metallo-hydrolase n=1 Tax=Phreatobacter sp. TaxID=1966341 RepID=UPI003F72067B